MSDSEEQLNIQRCGEMTFQQIGEALGIKTHQAQQIYQKALRKLKKNPQCVEMLEISKIKPKMRQRG